MAVPRSSRTSTLREVRARIDELDRILGACPPSRADEIARERRNRDALLRKSPEVQTKPWFAPRLRVYDARIAALEGQRAAHDQFMI